MAGTRQLMAVIFNTFPAADRIGHGKQPAGFFGRDLRAVPCARKGYRRPSACITSFKDDEANTRTETVLMMLVGGGRSGGIHGAHSGPGVQIRYAAADKKRQTIPWVEYRNGDGATPNLSRQATLSRSGLGHARFEMQCVDCHNRPAHSFELPDSRGR